MLPAVIVALHDNHPKLAEMFPLLFAFVAVEIVIIFAELPDYGRFAILDVADFRAFDLKEVVKRIRAAGKLRVGDCEISIGSDRLFLQTFLLPVKLKAVRVAELLKRRMKK